MDKIASPRSWQLISYILEESNIKEHRDKEVSLNLTMEDFIWMTIQAFNESIDLEVYEFLNNTSDADNNQFILYKTKALERFRKLFDACDQIGIKKESIVEIGQLRIIGEYSQLNEVNDIISEILGEEKEDNGKV